MNPAAELSAIFLRWMPQGGTPLQVRRKVAGGEERAMWRDSIRAAALLGEIDRALEGLREAGRSTNAYNSFVVEWQRGVFSAELQWNLNTDSPPVRTEALLALDGLALLLDVGALPPVDEARRAALLAILDDAQAALEEEGEHLSTADREYLWRLIAAAREFLAEKRGRGEADLRDHVDRLSGALVSMATRLAERGEKSAANRLFHLGLRLAAAGRTGLYDAAAFATIAATTIDSVRAITGQ